MNFIISILAFIFILSVIVFVHELGHFLAAKKFNVYCGEFSIGMGPVLWKYQGKETQYSLRAFPVGGFVSMAGEGDSSKIESDVPFERTIHGIYTWKKIIIMVAGIIMNIVLAWLLLVGLHMYTGSVAEPAKPRFDVVEKGSIAEEAGFMDGDYILSLKGEDEKVIVPKSFNDIREAINLSPQAYTFQVQRGRDVLAIQVKPQANEDGAYVIGVSASVNRKDIKWYEAFQYGTNDILYSSNLIYKSLSLLISGQNLDQISGPIGIYKVTEIAVAAGWLTFFHLIALLSLNIGLFNAFPIPILDGGRVLIVLLEKIMRRSINEKLLKASMYVGSFLLIGLMLYATYHDILRLF